jgi:AraC-like DNA-binding protein
MPTAWRAADIAPSDRADAFVEEVCETIVPYGDAADFNVAEEDEIHAASVGMLRVMHLRWRHGSATRSPRLIRRSDPELCKIDIALSGRFASEQSGRRVALDAGTFTFVDLSRPHRVAARRAELTVVMFPRALLPLRDQDIKDLTGASFDARQAGSALVNAVAREMAADLSTYEGAAGARMAAAVLDLIAATLATRVNRIQSLPVDSRQRLLVHRIRAYIEANLADPDLAPAAIAARHHISTRLLHKLFQSEDTTVADLIRSRRLARCRQDLLDQAQAMTPVSAIAARWGLRDAAYFNRIFHAAYGLPPGEYRRVRLGGDDASRPVAQMGRTAKAMST